MRGREERKAVGFSQTHDVSQMRSRPAQASLSTGRPQGCWGPSQALRPPSSSRRELSLCSRNVHVAPLDRKLLERRDCALLATKP